MTLAPPPIARLVTCSTAPNPRRVRAFLIEKGLELPTTEIDLASKAHFSDAHLAKFGTHHLPAVELADGSALTETVAICRYIEALHPEPNLMGRDPLEAARVEQWQRRAEFLVLQPVAFVFRHSHPSMAALETQIPAWAEANRPRVMQGLGLLDRRLADAPHLGGERFSIADITAWLALDFMRVTKLAVPEDHVHLLRWQAELAARPSLQRPPR